MTPKYDTVACILAPDRITSTEFGRAVTPASPVIPVFQVLSCYMNG